MDIFEYITFVSEKMKVAHDKNDKEEFVRITKVMIDVLNEKVEDLLKDQL